jgi:dihydroorotate dehydrogenase (NAD+) catalytic subunit
VAVRAVFQVARALPEVPLIGMGGIRTWEDAVELLLAGAWAVAIGTTNFFNPHATIEVAQGVGRFLAARELSSPADLRGKVLAGAEVREPAYRGG